MIILSVGMPRAGSGWYYNLTNELMLAAGGQDARQIRSRYHLNNILTEVNCNIGALTPRRVLAVMVPSLLGNTFVIKAHAGPTPIALNLIRARQIRPAYIYRDPRDALLSAFENGQRALQKGRSNAFSHLSDFNKSVDFMMGYVKIWELWMGCDLALHTRYEDLLNNYEVEAMRLVKFLDLDENNSLLQTILEKYRPEGGSPEQKGVHFNKGKTGRFRQKMTLEQQEILSQKFNPYLKRMGYEV
jgi:hypothetical protein